MMTLREAYEAMTPLVRPLKPAGRRMLNPLVARRKYRGKEQYIVGYVWCRKHSHHMSGMAYDCILGWGDTWGTAIAKAHNTIKRFSSDR